MANVVPTGFYDLRDLYSETVSQVGIEVVSEAVDASLAEYNKTIEAMYGLFASRTTEYQARFKSPKIRKMSGASEYTRAIPAKGSSRYTVAWPKQKGIAGEGYTHDAAARMTVKDAADETAGIMIADAAWQRDLMFAALFSTANWTWSDEDHGDIVIYPIANGDTAVYQIRSGAEQGATDDHHLFQAAAILDTSDPYPTLHAELTEHPENGDTIVCLIPTGLKTATRNLAAFNSPQDPNLRPGASATALAGTLGVNVPGKLVGYHDEGVWIVEWPSLPVGYIIAVAVGAGGASPLRMREDTVLNLQGLRRVAQEKRHPFELATFERLAGFGGWNRVAAAVMQIGNGSYAIPSGYTAPIA